jgi:catalase-peroxidase
MTVLIGGMRVLGTNTGSSKHGVFTTTPEALIDRSFIDKRDNSP